MIGALALAVALVAAPAACTVDDATLDWGFKESFRSYISGSIANGEWTVADGATYSTPTFGFTGGSGSLTDGVGTIAFPGSIEFTGHGGALDTTVANPQLRFDGSATAILLLDVAGTTQEGSQVAETAVPFATVDLAGGVADDGHYRLDAAPTELTAEGAAAFGTYAAGDALDPVILDLPVRVPCAPGQDGAEALVLLVVGAGIALLVGLLVVGALVTVVLLVRRTRRASLDLE
jgi:hypothetical protein